jgi:hypothetical protein
VLTEKTQRSLPPPYEDTLLIIVGISCAAIIILVAVTMGIFHFNKIKKSKINHGENEASNERRLETTI